MTLVQQPENSVFKTEEKPGGICITWTLQGLVITEFQVGPICYPSSCCPPTPAHPTSSSF